MKEYKKAVEKAERVLADQLESYDESKAIIAVGYAIVALAKAIVAIKK